MKRTSAGSLRRRAAWRQPVGGGGHYGVAARLLFRWKQELTQVAPLFVAVEIVRFPPTEEHRSWTLLPRGVKVHLAFGYIDMRKGIDGLTMLVQGVLRQDPFSGHLFVFRGRKANLIKIVVHWDGTGLCLFTKRLEHGVFLWPSNVEPGGTLMLTPAQLSMLIDGVDWRAPQRSSDQRSRDNRCDRLTQYGHGR